MTRNTPIAPIVQSHTAGEIGAPSQDFEDFVYLISHDVRNSVRALIELPQWIADDLHDSGVKIEGSVEQSIDLMNRHTGRLDRMLVDLLAFSRIGRMQTINEIDLDAALTDVLEEMNVPAGFKVIRALDCRSVTMGDRDILTLLTALVSNAIRHHDKKTGKVLVMSHQDRNEVVITVRDDGPGIEKQFRERVFGAMTTLRPRDEVEGSGMGLAIARKIAQLYRGSIAIIDDASSAGTSVEVRLPATRLM